MKSQIYFLARCLAALSLVLSLGACSESSSSSDDESEQDLSLEEAAALVHALSVSDAQGVIITGSQSQTGNSLVVSRSQSLESWQPRNSAVSLDPETIYKVTPAGTLEKVEVTQESGDPLPADLLKPELVHELGEQFLAIAFLYEYSWKNCTHTEASPCESGADEYYNEIDRLYYLVHQPSGRAYHLNDLMRSYPISSHEDDLLEDLKITWDMNRNAYLLTDEDWHRSEDDGEQLIRIPLGDLSLDSLDAQTLPMTPGDQLDHFVAEGEGRFLLYSAQGTEDSSVSRLRLLDLSSNTILPVGPALDGMKARPDDEDSDPIETGFLMLRDSEGAIYFFAGNQMLSYFPNWGERNAAAEEGLFELPKLFRIDLEDGEIALDRRTIQLTRAVDTDDAELDKDYYYVFDSLTSFNRTGGYGYYRVSGRDYIIHSDSYYSFVPTEYNLSTGEVIVHHHATGMLDKVLQYDVTDNYFWYRGEDTSQRSLLVRYDPLTTEVVSNELEDSNLELTFFEPIGSDRIFFEANDLSISGRVRGEVDLNGNVTNLQTLSEFEPQIIALQAISPADFITIDGNPSDWNTGLRVLEVATGNDNLLAYSSTATDRQYYGLIEFDTAIDEDLYTRIEFDTHVILLGPDLFLVEADTSLVFPDDIEDLDNGGRMAARTSGGRMAVQQAIEFSLPRSLLGEGQLPVLQSVTRLDADGEVKGGLN